MLQAPRRRNVNTATGPPASRIDKYATLLQFNDLNCKLQSVPQTAELAKGTQFRLSREAFRRLSSMVVQPRCAAAWQAVTATGSTSSNCHNSSA
jgi:hypothetical protein